MPRTTGNLVIALLLALSTCSITRAAVVRTMFTFDAGAEPAFKFVSGDLPCEVIAEVSGSFVLQYDVDTGEASLSSLAATLTSAQTAMGGSPWEYPAGHFCSQHRDDLEGSAISSVLPGFAAGMQGQRTGPSEFTFGPALTDEEAFLWQFVLSTTMQSSRFFGSSLFYGDDGPSYFLDASITAVPEPTGWLIAASSFQLTQLLRGRRRSHG